MPVFVDVGSELSIDLSDVEAANSPKYVGGFSALLVWLFLYVPELSYALLPKTTGHLPEIRIRRGGAGRSLPSSQRPIQQKQTIGQNVLSCRLGASYFRQTALKEIP
jgi:hypothetical protein